MRFAPSYEVTTKEGVWGEGVSYSKGICKDEAACCGSVPVKIYTDFDLTIREGTSIVEGFASSAMALRRRLA
jgi:hypothetical protein